MSSTPPFKLNPEKGGRGKEKKSWANCTVEREKGKGEGSRFFCPSPASKPPRRGGGALRIVIVTSRPEKKKKKKGGKFLPLREEKKRS